jgi:ubiquinone/menaquinone biosynthesis C-methylase UbiE
MPFFLFMKANVNLAPSMDKYQNSNPIQKFLINNFINSLQRQLRLIPAESILEVGCGEGYILRELSRSCKPQIPLFATDINDDCIKECRRLNSGVMLLRSDILRLPFKENSVGLLICLEVLEHLKEPKKALLELRRVCSRYVILSVPNQPYFRIGNFLRLRYIKRLGNQDGHIQLWTAAEFIDLVGKYFRIIKIAKPFPWVMLLCKND